MFEHSSLQEAYTGSLIAGKGRNLNNIKSIMTQTKFKTEEWTRVRFGAGTPWRRCWCVISPPDEKEVQKAQKVMKKRSAYDRQPIILRGDVKFYDTRKTKKATPVATISDAYSAYAIYPQSKPLIEQSTLIKIDGKITIHSKPETVLESFVFVMPEARPAVSGFEMLLRFLFPIWDVFALYGRPTKLIPDTLDTRSLMFAMPKSDRYGYLEILDVAGLVHAPGSQNWKESEWKRELKQLTAQRISKMSRQQSQASRLGSVRGHAHRNSLPSRSGTLRFEDEGSMRSTPSLHDRTEFKPPPIPHTDSAPPGAGPFPPPNTKHSRSISAELKPTPPMHRRPRNFTDGSNYVPSHLSRDADMPRDSFDEEEEAGETGPPPPAHTIPVGMPYGPMASSRTSSDGLQYRSSSESERRMQDPSPHAGGQTEQTILPAKPPSPVAEPPIFSHEPGAKPQKRPYHSPELRRANSRMSSTTLSQLAAASNAGSGGVAGTGAASVAGAAAAAAMANASRAEGRRSEDQGFRGVNHDYDTSRNELPADYEFPNQGLALENAGLPQSNSSSRSTVESSPTSNHNPASNLKAPNKGFARSVSPLSQVSTMSPPPQPPKSPAYSNSYFSTPVEYSTYTPTQDSAYVTPTTPQRSSRPTSSGMITRKPVPSPGKEEPKSAKVLSDEDLRARDVDAAINRMSTIDSRKTQTSTRYSEDSSLYDDTESNATPNYDSPEASITDRALPMLPDKPRTGVLKTVGTLDPSQREVVVGDVHYKPEENQTLGADIPSIDFGPTQLYRPDLQPSHGRSKSADRLGYGVGNSSSDNLLGGGRGRVTPSHVIDAYNRSPSRSALPTPEAGQSRTASAEGNENRRSMLWQPGAAIGSGRQSPGPSLTPEQFVQQRAAANRAPAYPSHQRHGSNTPPRAHSRQDSRTPPLLSSRPISGDWAGVPRPSSRGAGTVMNSTQDYSQHLSAREQEHVARVTNSPLISLAGNSHQRSQSQGGLIGAIEAREQEKKAAKEGYGGYMVQQAIAQRQQHAHSHSQQGYSPQPYQHPQPSPQMDIPGQFPITPQVDTAGWDYQQQQYVNQNAPSQYGYRSQAGYSPRQPHQQGSSYPQFPPQQGGRGQQHYDQNYYSR